MQTTADDRAGGLDYRHGLFRSRRGRAVVRGAAGGRVAGGRRRRFGALAVDEAGDRPAVAADRVAVGAVLVVRGDRQDGLEVGRESGGGVVEAVVVGRTAGAGDRPRRVRDGRGRAVVRGAAGSGVAGRRRRRFGALAVDEAGDRPAVAADRVAVGAVLVVRGDRQDGL